MNDVRPSASLDKICGSTVIYKTKLFRFTLYCLTVRDFSNQYFYIRQKLFDALNKDALTGKISNAVLDNHQYAMLNEFSKRIHLFGFKMSWKKLSVLIWLRLIRNSDVAKMMQVILELGKLPNLTYVTSEGINILPANPNAVSEIDWGDMIALVCNAYHVSTEQVLDMPISRFNVLMSRISMLPRGGF